MKETLKHCWLIIKHRVAELFRKSSDEDDLLCTVYVCKKCRLTTTQVYGAQAPLMCGRCGAPFVGAR